MFEYEKKMILTNDEYRAIISLMCDRIKKKTQTNYYFDDDNYTMNKNGITCRVRSKDGKYTATIKNHKLDNPDCSIEIDWIKKDRFDPQIFNVLGLHYQGGMVTERIVVYKEPACEIVLDRNKYLGYTDFELEIEYQKEHEKTADVLLEYIAKQLLEDKKIKSAEEFLSRVGKSGFKSERFFEHLKIGGIK